MNKLLSLAHYKQLLKQVDNGEICWLDIEFLRYRVSVKLQIAYD